jgi:hypothetical protein
MMILLPTQIQRRVKLHKILGLEEVHAHGDILAKQDLVVDTTILDFVETSERTENSIAKMKMRVKEMTKKKKKKKRRKRKKETKRMGPSIVSASE